jgi:hypothetical protein
VRSTGQREKGAATACSVVLACRGGSYIGAESCRSVQGHGSEAVLIREMVLGWRRKERDARCLWDGMRWGAGC